MDDRIENNFTYHPVREGQPAIYKKIRDTAKSFTYLVWEMCPESRERSIAMTKIEEAVMWANAAMARNK